MAKSETSAPRGTNKVIKAFFEALDSTPDAGRSQVARAALAAIREKLTARKDKEKATRQKEKAKSARGRTVPAPRKAASSSRATSAGRTVSAAAKPARSKRVAAASAPKATKRASPRRAATTAAEAPPQSRKAVTRRSSIRKKPVSEAAPMDSQTAQDSNPTNGASPDGTTNAE